MGILANLNNVGSSLQNITGIVNQYVVSPLAVFGMAGYVFNATGEAHATLSAEITDHYAEDNTAIQDQVAVRPKRVTLKGYVGEVIFNGAGSSPSTLNSLAQKLTSLSAFLPTISSAATQAQALITNPATATFSSVLTASSNIYALVKNVFQSFGNTKNQQNAYLYFKALMQSATLMSIQTPWEFMPSMAIESITAIQPENSQWISDFSVTFKEIRIVSSSTVAFSNASAQASANSGNVPAVLQGAASLQQSAVTNLGNIAGAATNISIAPGLF